MSTSLTLALAALAAQAPAVLLAWKRAAAPEPAGAAFWAALAAAVIGAGAAAWGHQAAAGWSGGLSAALFVSAAVSLLVFAAVCAVWREAAGLTVLLSPYIALVILLALLLRGTPGAALSGPPDAWLVLHIAVSVATYAVVTVAAVAALAAFLQDRALKAKRAGGFARALPPLAFSETLTVRLLAAGEAVLALGILSGVAEALTAAGGELRLDHKTALSLSAFAVIALVLWSHHRHGARGRGAARLALLAWLLLTLGYPGVKFVRHVILA
ncbi:MAG: cytochrome c biogenesis protein CcsA [Rhodospirillales bacterium]